MKTRFVIVRILFVLFIGLLLLMAKNQFDDEKKNISIDKVSGDLIYPR